MAEKTVTWHWESRARLVHDGLEVGLDSGHQQSHVSARSGKSPWVGQELAFRAAFSSWRLAALRFTKKRDRAAPEVET